MYWENTPAGMLNLPDASLYSMIWRPVMETKEVMIKTRYFRMRLSHREMGLHEDLSEIPKHMFKVQGLKSEINLDFWNKFKSFETVKNF